MSDNKKVSGSTLSYAISKLTGMIDAKPDTAADIGSPTIEEMNAAIAAIPTPDVSGQINTHNVSTDAHSDIRAAVSNAQSKADSAYTLASGKADPSSIPTKTSQLTNDSGYITSIPSTYATDTEVSGQIDSHNTSSDSHNDIRDAISTKQDDLSTLTWSPSTLPSNSTWEAIAYGNGMFVAIANESNKTAYSTDGEHWTETTNLPSESSWYSITYGNRKFVAVAYGTVAAYSTDGIAWTATSLPSSRNWCSVAYGNGMFVAIAGSSNVAAYSIDGINWQLSNITVGVSWESVAYGNGMFVAIENGTSVAAYSTDGITWTAGTLPQSTRWRSLTYGNGRFVAVAYNTNIAAYSIDGIHWTESTLPTKTYWCSVAYGNGIFVVVTYNKTISAYSTDGENWTEITLPHSAYGFAATYGNGIFAAVGYSTDRAVYAKMPAVLVSGFESDVKGIVVEATANKVDTTGDTMTGDLTIDAGTEAKAFTVKRTVSDVVGEAKLNVTSMSSVPVAGLTLVHNGSSQAGIYVKKDQATFYNHKTGNSYEMLHKGNLLTETWTFTLEDGSTVTKAVYVG